MSSAGGVWTGWFVISKTSKTAALILRSIFTVIVNHINFTVSSHITFALLSFSLSIFLLVPSLSFSSNCFFSAFSYGNINDANEQYVSSKPETSPIIMLK